MLLPCEDYASRNESNLSSKYPYYFSSWRTKNKWVIDSIATVVLTKCRCINRSMILLSAKYPILVCYLNHIYFPLLYWFAWTTIVFA